MSIDKINQILSEQNEICSIINEYNYFCSKYFFINIITFLPISLFDIIIISNPLTHFIWKCFLIGPLVSKGLFLFFVSFSTASVTKQIHASRPLVGDGSMSLEFRPNQVRRSTFQSPPDRLDWHARRREFVRNVRVVCWSHGASRIRNHRSDSASLWARRVFIAHRAPILVSVIRHSHGDGLALLGHHHECFRRLEKGPRPIGTRTWNLRLWWARSTLTKNTR